MGEIVLGYGAPPLPFGAVDDIGAFGAYVLFRGADPLNLGAHEGQHYLLVASPFDRGDPLTAGKAGAGALRIADPGGELDNLLQLGWDGAAIFLKRGSERD